MVIMIIIIDGTETPGSEERFSARWDKPECVHHQRCLL